MRWGGASAGGGGEDSSSCQTHGEGEALWLLQGMPPSCSSGWMWL